MSGASTRSDSIIFVWDLDQTLAHRNGSNTYINLRALRCMHKLFNSPRYGANLLLTNNSSTEYINHIHQGLTEQYNKMFPDETEDLLFDNIYTAGRKNNGSYSTPRVLDESVPEWIRTPNHLAKRLEDVANMLRDIELYDSLDSLDSLAYRVFFFDDLPNHNIRTELPAGHYIQITPPFKGPGEDNTDYSSAENAVLTPSAENAVPTPSAKNAVPIPNSNIEIVVQKGGASKKYRKTKGKGKKRRGKKLTKRKSG
jgi:hypothetical protein